MAGRLDGEHIAILATDGFEQSELEKPLEALRNEGAQVQVIAPKTGRIQGMEHHEKGRQIEVDLPLDSADPKSFDALVLPGGVANPDALRMDDKAVDFVRHFIEWRKPIAAICHGPWTLIEAGGVRGKKMTSWPSLHTDLANAGANWVDQEVVRDGELVTSRRPDDLPAFCRETVNLFAEAGQHHTAA